MVAPTSGLIYSTIATSTAIVFYASGGLAGAVFAWLRKRGGLATSDAIGASKPAVSSTVASLLVVVGLLGLVPSKQVYAETGYEIQTVATGLEKPWSVAFLPDGRQLITEKPGRLRVVDQGSLVPKAVSGVPDVLYAGQGGLFEVLPAQDFADSQLIYLSYACGTRGANGTCVARGKLDGITLTNVQPIFKTDFSKSGGAHFGGRMVWLADGTLVLTLGDGYSYRDEAQNIANQFGTLVRLNADGSIPKDNPFVGKAGANPAIYSYGHRSVQGLVFDAESGRLYEHEHGARGGDEINIIEAGKNYGWPLATYGIDYSGAKISPYTAYEGTQQPIVYWLPSIAPSGMTLYKGDLFPQWQGDLLVGALAGRHVRLVELDKGKVVGEKSLFSELGERIRDVRTGPDGALYLLIDSSDGRLLRVVPKP